MASAPPVALRRSTVWRPPEDVQDHLL